VPTAAYVNGRWCDCERSEARAMCDPLGDIACLQRIGPRGEQGRELEF
jgi:hypothetical protein